MSNMTCGKIINTPQVSDTFHRTMTSISCMQGLLDDDSQINSDAFTFLFIFEHLARREAKPLLFECTETILIVRKGILDQIS